MLDYKSYTDMATFRVGNTLRGKYIFCPTQIKDINSFLDYLLDDFDDFELFDTYALYEYFIQRELIKKASDQRFFQIYEKVSDRLFQYLAVNHALYEIMDLQGLHTSVDICSYGSRLCLFL